MPMLLQYWPLLAFMTSLFISGLGVAIGLTMWIMGKLIEQDAKRIEMKETLLHEVRGRHKTVMDAIEQRYAITDAKIDSLIEEDDVLGNRMTRVETLLGNGNIKQRQT